MSTYIHICIYTYKYTCICMYPFISNVGGFSLSILPKAPKTFKVFWGEGLGCRGQGVGFG